MQLVHIWILFNSLSEALCNHDSQMSGMCRKGLLTCRHQRLKRSKFGIPTLGNIDSHWNRVFESSTLVSKRSARFNALASLGRQLKQTEQQLLRVMLLKSHTHDPWAKKNLCEGGLCILYGTFWTSKRWPIWYNLRIGSGPFRNQLSAQQPTTSNEEHHNSSLFASWLLTTNNSKQLYYYYVIVIIVGWVCCNCNCWPAWSKFWHLDRNFFVVALAKDSHHPIQENNDFLRLEVLETENSSSSRHDKFPDLFDPAIGDESLSSFDPQKSRKNGHTWSVRHDDAWILDQPKQIQVSYV